MFNSKKKQLFDISEKETSENKLITQDPFLRAAIKSDTVLSGNLSDKIKTMGSSFLDQFASASKYKEPRSYADISKDMSTLWGKDPLLTIKFTVYLRLITRIPTILNGDKLEKSHKGQGLKHESIMRMIWLFVNHPKEFIDNLNIFVIAGSWKDLITMMKYDAMYNGHDHSFDWNILIEFIKEGLMNPETSNLIRKYLPTIRTKKKCTTIEAQANNVVAKALCHSFFGGKEYDNPGRFYRLYRKTKSSGTAHEWQQLISKRRFKDINFGTIAGRALQKLVNSKFLENQGLEKKYESWLDTQPTAKYTGYVYELFAPFQGVYNAILPIKPYQKKTINAQFQELLNKAELKTEDNSFICVLDSSMSMSSAADGTTTHAYTVAKTMTLFFSELLKGRFHEHYFEFSSDTELRKFEGETYYDKYVNSDSRINANTNFISVADKFVEILKSETLLEDDFPKGILCLTDGEFDRTHDFTRKNTELDKFRKKLLNGGFSKEFVKNFKIVLWDIPNGYYGKSEVKFEALGDEANTFHIGGLDGSIVSFLIEGEVKDGKAQTPQSTEELFLAAMNQELMNYVII